MAKVVKAARKPARPVKKTYASPFSIYWAKENYIFLFAGIAIIIVGFYLMSVGKWDDPLALNVSPILLVAGYFIALPLAILFRKRLSRTEKTAAEE